MNSYLVSYDLIAPTKDYSDLYKAIKSFPGWARVNDSCWVIKSSLASAEIRDSLRLHTDNNDELFVCKLAGEGAWRNLSEDVSKWLKDNL